MPDRILSHQLSQIPRSVKSGHAVGSQPEATKIDHRGMPMRRLFTLRCPCPQREKWLAAAIVVIAVALRLGLAISLVRQPERYFQSDAYGYENLANNLLRFHAFTASEAPPLEPDTFRTPLYPLFMAAIYAVFGHQPFVIVLVQCGASLMSLWFVFLLADRMFGRSAALLAALWMALDLGQVIFASLIMTETVFVTLLVLSTWCTWRLISATIRRKKLIYAGLTGITAGLAALCRPVAMYLPVVMAFVVGVLWLERGHSSRTVWRHVRQTVVIVLLFVATLSPWLLRNAILFRSPQLSSIQGFNLLFHNTAYMRARLEGSTWKEAYTQIRAEVQAETGNRQLNPLELADYYQQKAIREIAGHPAAYAHAHLEGIFWLFAMPNTNFLANLLGILDHPTGIIANLRTRDPSANLQALQGFWNDFVRGSPAQLIFLLALVLEMLILGCIYVGALLGIAASIRKKKWILLAILLGQIGYFALLAGPLGYGRFRIPAMPFICILAGSGWAWALSYTRHRLR
jgi:4-amino-4-deoxy-L-arabinose transferase-like glycosyltransferase